MEAAAAAQKTEERGHRKTRSGVVVSDKMDKTVVVRIERIKMHTKYKKYIRIWKTVKAHDEKNDCHVGDLVQLAETRPLSKDKRWRVQKIIKRAAQD
jgi:small subunit ribosomal protein S17